MDLEKFFDSVCRKKLLQILTRDILDKRVLNLINAYINSDVIDNGRLIHTNAGLPQGGPLSPLLANIMLNELDNELSRRHEIFVRYADDMIIFCKNQSSARNALGNVEINKSLLELLTDKGIIIHFFDYYGSYSGTYYPPESKNSGQVFLAQAAFCLDERKRHELASIFVTGAIRNMIGLINYYQRRHEHIQSQDITEYLRFCMTQAPKTYDINSLMGIEGTARCMYYEFFDRLILDDNFKIVKRVRRPLNNIMNALISFINSMCYAETLTQIYHTHLDPRISFLHSPSDFEHAKNGGIYACHDTRKIITEAWEKSLRHTITYPATGQKMGWRRVIRSEALNVQKFIIDGIPYKSFIFDW